MKELISLAQMFDEIMAKNREARFTLEVAEDTTQIIDFLVMKRKRLGLSRAAVAKACGIKEEELEKVETLEKMPSLSLVASLARVVGLRIGIL